MSDAHDIAKGLSPGFKRMESDLTTGIREVPMQVCFRFEEFARGRNRMAFANERSKVGDQTISGV